MEEEEEEGGGKEEEEETQRSGRERTHAVYSEL